jgi:hypothetical protein
MKPVIIIIDMLREAVETDNEAARKPQTRFIQQRLLMTVALLHPFFSHKIA